MARDWKNIAVLLSIPHHVTEVIEAENPRAVKDCLRTMLVEWLKQTDPFPKWSALAEAIEFLGNREMARDIRNKYCPGS